MADILIVDDDENICAAFQQFIRELGHEPRIASNGADAIAIVSECHPDLVIMDIRMPGTDGLEALPAIRAADPEVPVVMMTAYGTSQTSIEATRLGAFEYITKPLDLDVLGPVIQKGLEVRGAGREARLAIDPDSDRYELVELVGNSPAMLAVYKRIGLLTGKDVPVLIRGEKGVGKKLGARTIHANSPRSEGPFVVVSCRSLVSELPDGKLELAEAGTLLLEDVDALPLALQALVLEALGEREAAGDPVPRPIATTTADLGALVADGAFDEDLAETLGLVTIELPPLRERAEDIPDLVGFFMSRCNANFDTAIKGVDARVEELLRRHGWPGNVRQLENVIKRGCLLAHGDTITADDLGDGLTERPKPGGEAVQADFARTIHEALEQRLDAEATADRGSPFHDVVAQVEEALIREALARTGGNQLRAAGLLELNRTTLRKKIQLYNI